MGTSVPYLNMLLFSQLRNLLGKCLVYGLQFGLCQHFHYKPFERLFNMAINFIKVWSKQRFCIVFGIYVGEKKGFSFHIILNRLINIFLDCLLTEKILYFEVYMEIKCIRAILQMCMLTVNDVPFLISHKLILKAFKVYSTDTFA